MHARRPFLVVPVTLAAALAITASASPAPGSCGSPGYTYAGLESRSNAFGVSGTVSATAGALVEHGHVAAWIGVGAPDEGPHGTREWLQVGLNTMAGNTAALYYEVAQRSGIRYVGLASGVPVGRTYDVAVIEVPGKKDIWRVWVDGAPASRPIWLPGSHGTLTPMAMAESWGGGQAACNRYAYRFSSVSLAGRPGGAWTRLRRHAADVLQNPDAHVVPASNGFLAVTAPAPPRSAPRIPAGRSAAGSAPSGEGITPPGDDDAPTPADEGAVHGRPTHEENR